MKLKLVDKEKHIYDVSVSPRDVWSLDWTLAQILSQSIKSYKTISYGHPGNLSEEEWGQILDEMIDGFDYFINEWNFSDEGRDRIQRSVDLFAKHFLSLWMS